MYSSNGRTSGKAYDNRRIDKHKKNTQNHNGTSTFNPVVCEVVYKWFLPGEHCKIFDPFAGGVVRGGVAAVLGHQYVGYDINPNQVESNYEEYRKLSEKYVIEGTADWVQWDSCGQRVVPVSAGMDLIFTCPPYFNLERYTDLPADLSNLESYDEFLQRYESAIHFTYSFLKDNRFSVWVVSDVRDRVTSEYYGLVADTIKLHQKAGFKFYNEIILMNDTGNLAITSGDYLDRARKVGRQHQNILIFYKGNPRQIGEEFGAVFEGDK